MEITWFGHAAFLLEASDGTRIIIDPYRSGSFDGAINYKPIDEPADAVLATHTHEDHAATDTIPGDPRVLISPERAEVGAFRIRGVPTFHDTEQGGARGENTVLAIEADGLRMVHLGDLGHEPGPDVLEVIGEVDILMVPVGGTFTIDAPVAANVVADIDPKIVIPMHYKTSRCAFDIEPVDDFLELHGPSREIGSPSLRVSPETLPPERTAYVLDYVD